MFDALMMAAIAAELNATILNGRVQRVVQSGPRVIGLEVYAQHCRHQLLASAHSQHARVHLSQEKPTRDPQAQSPLLLHLRRRVRGAILQEISIPPLERILMLHFHHPGLPAEEQENTLVVEVMGRHSNLILMDGQQIILDSIKRVTLQMSPNRPVLPHQVYMPPPPQAKMDPRHLSPNSLGHALAGLEAPLWQALVNLYRGISPQLAREIVFRAGGDVERPAADPGNLARLAEEITTFWSRPATGEWAPSLALQDDHAVGCAPYRLTHGPTWQVRAYESASQAVEACFAAREPATGHQQLRRILLDAIRAQRERVVKRLGALQDEMKRADQAQELRQKGEWLLAYQHQVEPGQTVLRVEGLEIALNPQRTPVENAQEYFATYRKAVQANRLLPRRIAETEQERDWLAELTALVHNAETYDELSILGTELQEAGILAPRRTTRFRKAKLPPRTYQTADGFAILVGRNARQNEEITFRKARPHDLWLHVRGRPGAHVVIVTEGRPIPDETLKTAAALAAYYSQGRREKRVAVDFTERRNVRRLNAQRPGLVRYKGERTVLAAPARPPQAD
jgi:predicted ribosome quality control (RQC) complex YloA/Tae2 family protein